MTSMNERKLVAKLRQRHAVCSLEWVQENCPASDSFDACQEALYGKWLTTELKDSCPPDTNTMPQLDENGSGSFSRDCAFQIDGVLDVGQSAFAQLEVYRKSKGFKKRGADTTIENEEGVSDELSDTAAERAQLAQLGDDVKPRVGTTLLKLKLTDGRNTIVAMEFKPLPFITRLTTPGSKILLRKGALIRRRIVLMTPQNTSLLGGGIPSLIATKGYGAILHVCFDMDPTGVDLSSHEGDTTEENQPLPTTTSSRTSAPSPVRRARERPAQPPAARAQKSSTSVQGKSKAKPKAKRGAATDKSSAKGDRTKRGKQVFAPAKGGTDIELIGSDSEEECVVGQRNGSDNDDDDAMDDAILLENMAQFDNAVAPARHQQQQRRQEEGRKAEPNNSKTEDDTQEARAKSHHQAQSRGKSAQVSPTKRKTTIQIKGSISSFGEGLKIKEGEWSLSITIAPSSASGMQKTLRATVLPQYLSSMIGFTPEQFKAQKRAAKKNPELKAALMKNLQRVEEKMMAHSASMELQVPDGVPTGTHVLTSYKAL